MDCIKISHIFPDQEIIAELAKKSSSNVPFQKLYPRRKTTYMPRHTASYGPIKMTCEKIHQNNMLEAPASRPLISCNSASNPTHSDAL
jgi:hypothetical protein